MWFTEFDFFVPGEVRGKARHRMGKFGSYNPTTNVNYESLVVSCFASKYGNIKPLEGALMMITYAYLPIPKSTSQKQRKLMMDRIILPTKKPDFDNIEKITSDALNKVAYLDDAQVCAAQFSKYFSDILGVRVIIKSWKPKLL